DLHSELPAAARGSGGRMRWGRWAALFFAFTFEYYAVTAGVDAQLVANARGGWWSALVNFEHIARAAFLCATCALVLMRPSRTQVRSLEPRNERALYGAHALIFGGF